MRSRDAVRPSGRGMLVPTAEPSVQSRRERRISRCDRNLRGLYWPPLPCQATGPRGGKWGVWHSRSMSDSTSVARSLTQWATEPGPGAAARLSSMASGLAFSDIFRVASEIRAMTAAGPIGRRLHHRRLQPKRSSPSPGGSPRPSGRPSRTARPTTPLPTACPSCARRSESCMPGSWGSTTPSSRSPSPAVDGPWSTGSSGPSAIRATALVYGVPSWNNHYYAHMVGATSVTLDCRPEDRFLPTRESLQASLPGARLVCLNSPLNPSGTAIARDTLLAICEAILGENAGRERAAASGPSTCSTTRSTGC